ncbi:MAG: hypothetical protein FWH50_02145 [Coriobacteriia bacterium]|nr:hypothetical protein [Coriobacteriia bacterium]
MSSEPLRATADIIDFDNHTKMSVIFRNGSAAEIAYGDIRSAVIEGKSIPRLVIGMKDGTTLVLKAATGQVLAAAKMIADNGIAVGVRGLNRSQIAIIKQEFNKAESGEQTMQRQESPNA